MLRLRWAMWLNPDFSEAHDFSRGSFTFGKSINWSEAQGGIKRFNDLKPETLETLIEGGFVDPESRQNMGPTLEEFLDYSRGVDFVKFTGYVVSPKRKDCRVTISGIVIDNAEDDAIQSFIDRFRHATEFNVDFSSGYGRAWWD